MANVAFLLADDFEDTEFKVPYDRLQQAGHTVTLLGLKRGVQVRGKQGRELANITATVDEVNPQDFAALIIPGGYSPDKLRMSADVVNFVKTFAGLNRPIAAICHGPSLLVDADILRGKRVTSWASVRKDVENAGAWWEDREVVEDGNLITSRNPQDAPAFATAVLNRLKIAAIA